VWITAGLQNETYVIHFSNDIIDSIFVVLTRREKRGIHGISVKIVVDLFSFFLCDSVERMSLKSGYHGRKNLRPSPSSSNMASIMSGRLVTSDLNKSRVAGELAAAVLFRSWAKGRRSRGGVGGICCPRMVKFAKRRARGGHQLFFDGNKRANREVDFPIF
jgi:hypothetical protein